MKSQWQTGTVEDQDSQVAQFESSMAAQRKSLVGTGDCSDKIVRTIFSKQDDRPDQLNFYNFGDIMNGHIDDIIEAPCVAENIERMKERIRFKLGLFKYKIFTWI